MAVAFAAVTFGTQSSFLFPKGRFIAATRMHAYVYKSLSKSETYVYLAKRDDFDVIPASVRQPLGQLQFVLAVELTPERRLAQADAAKVRAQLAENGFYLQFPPSPASVVAAMVARDDD